MQRQQRGREKHRNTDKEKGREREREREKQRKRDTQREAIKCKLQELFPEQIGQLCNNDIH